MKKFLTVLLALSVVFTYTVGTAFAAAGTYDPDVTSSTVTKMANDRADAAIEALNANAKVVMLNLSFDADGNFATGTSATTPSVTDVKVSKAAVQSALNDLVADYTKAIRDAARVVSTTGKWYTTPATDTDKTYGDTQLTAIEYIDKTYAAVKTASNLSDALLDDDDVLALTKEFALVKTTAQSTLNNYADLSKYRATLIDGETKSPRELVQDIVTAQLKAVNDVTLADGANAEAAANAVEAVRKAVDDVAVEIKKAKIMTINEENLASSNLENQKVALKSQVTQLANITYAALYEALNDIVANSASTKEEVAAAQKKLSTLRSDIDKVKAYYHQLIDDAKTSAIAEGVVTTASSAFVPPTFYNADGILAKVVKADELIAYAKQEAKYKALRVFSDGARMFTQDAIDEVLKDAIAQINALTITTEVGVDALFTAMKNDRADIDTNRATEVATLKTDYGYATDASTPIVPGTNGSVKYYGPQHEAVVELIDAAEAKIKDATTNSAIAQIVKDVKKELDKLTTRVQADGLGIKAEYEKSYKAKLNAYVDTFFAKYPADAFDAGVKAKALADAEQVLYDAAVEANDVTAMAGAYAKATAVIDALQTKTQIKAAADKVIALIDAIDKTITLNSEAAIKAAKAAFDEYVKMTGADPTDISNELVLTTAIKTLNELKVAAVKDQIAALPATITLADKAAVEAAEAAVKALIDEKVIANANEVPNFTDLLADRIALDKAIKANAIDLISKLPADITIADKAAVEAAREAFDAMSIADQAAFDEYLTNKLNKAEDTLVVLEKAHNEYLKNGVKNTKAKITSAAYKGKIVLKFSRTKGFKVDGYQLYKSTKKSTGFKSIGKTTKTSYTNTKNLVKGKRYYYKVRGYRVIDGETVYTKFSGVVYRTAK
ncbi:hypothetical protein M2140_002025 [Clostridiales Family XIII bacterium PM5-7]